MEENQGSQYQINNKSSVSMQKELVTRLRLDLMDRIKSCLNEFEL